MEGRLTQNSYQPGTPMVVTLKPMLYGVAAEALESITADVILPDQERRMFSLHRVRDGYRGTFRDTHQAGPYHFDCTAVILTPSGVPVTRTRYLGGVILPPGKKKEPKPWLGKRADPSWWRVLWRFLLRLFRG